MDKQIVASIILYNPDINRLQENIESVAQQVEQIILVDNASNNIKNIEILKCVKENCILIKNDINVGLAKALNQAMQCALEHKYEWVLTLDQDSVCEKGLVEALARHIDKEKVGIIAPKFVDRNCKRVSDTEHGWKYVQRCITSASLTNIKIWENVGGFNSDLFIDFVDYDFCAKLIRNGYAIIKDSDISILHEIGHSKRIYIANKYSYILFNHSAIRDYYIVRNTLYYCYLYPDVWNVKQEKKELIVRCIMILVFEEDKFNKLKYMLKGWKDSRKFIKQEKEKKKLHKNQVRKQIADLKEIQDDEA